VNLSLLQEIAAGTAGFAVLTGIAFSRVPSRSLRIPGGSDEPGAGGSGPGRGPQGPTDPSPYDPDWDFDADVRRRTRTLDDMSDLTMAWFTVETAANQAPQEVSH
jgi:hypothetical protein